jgi:hypothetical protein
VNFFRGSVAHSDRAPGFDPGGNRFDPCRGFPIITRVHSSAGHTREAAQQLTEYAHETDRCEASSVEWTEHRFAMPEARGSTPRGRAHHGGMAQRLEQLSHKQLDGVFDSHSRHPTEWRWFWSSARRRFVSLDVLGDRSSCFDSEDESSRLRVAVQAVPVANATLYGE